MSISHDEMHKRLPGANAELVRKNDEIIIDYLSRFDSGRIMSRTQKAIIDLLPGGDVSVERIAQELRTSGRSLQRKLDTRNNHDFGAVIGRVAGIAARDAIGKVGLANFR
jgi:hypothetical protein